MTVRELFDFVHKHGVNLDAEIHYQRIEDTYFEGVDISGMRGTLPDGTGGILPPGSKATGWSVVRKKGDGYFDAKDWNPELTEEQLEEYCDQYVKAESVFQYDQDDDLYITAHY